MFGRKKPVSSAEIQEARNIYDAQCVETLSAFQNRGTEILELSDKSEQASTWRRFIKDITARINKEDKKLKKAWGTATRDTGGRTVLVLGTHAAACLGISLLAIVYAPALVLPLAIGGGVTGYFLARTVSKEAADVTARTKRLSKSFYNGKFVAYLKKMRETALTVAAKAQSGELATESERAVFTQIKPEFKKAVDGTSQAEAKPKPPITGAAGQMPGL